MQSLRTSRDAPLPWRALAGPAAMGMAMGLGASIGAVIQWGVALPLMVGGLALVLVPALYIAISLSGNAPAPAPGDVARAALTALNDVGTMLLGLAPALGFMVVTTQNRATIIVATVFLAIGVVLALRGLFLRLFATEGPVWVVPAPTVVAYLAWCAVSLGIGAQWFVERAFQTLGGGL